MKSAFKIVGIVVGVAILLWGLVFIYRDDDKPDYSLMTDQNIEDAALEAFQNTPLSFQKNEGQTDEVVQFFVKNGPTTIFFTPEEVVYSIFDQQQEDKSVKAEKEKEQPGTLYVIKQSFEKANEISNIQGVEEQQGKVNYFIGNDPDKWVSGAALYSKIIYEELYPGIDLEYSGSKSQLKYEFRVASGADPSQIRVKLEGFNQLSLASDGALVISLDLGNMGVKAPESFQMINGERIKVESSYVVVDEDSYSFELGEYNPDYELIIDPYMFYSGGRK